MSYEHVLVPIEINGLEIKNRVVRTAHGTNIGQGRVTDELIAYHEARAAGGCGLTILEAASVHPTDMGTLRLHDASVVDDYRRLMGRLAPYNMAVFQQLGHLGYEGVTADGGPPWSASEVAGPSIRRPAKSMTGDDIAELIDAFAQAARWSIEGGVHGVEVHIAHGYLLQQFMSSATNQRTDRYGGSWENRIRLVREVVGAVRETIGPGIPMGVRIGSEALGHGGVTEHDCAELVKVLADDGLIDYVNLTYGSCLRPHKIMGGMHEPPGYELEAAAPVVAAVDLPAIVTGRFRTLAEADELIARGVADMVGLTRAHIADPDLVAKSIEGREAEVRPCIAGNDGCVGGLNRGRLSCAVNPAVGRELEFPPTDSTSQSRRIVVVGGGPGGMEAARLAAEQGHSVVLFEARNRLGGAVRQAQELPTRGLLGDICDWQERELDRLGVDVQLNQTADGQSITSARPDLVVVATGATGAEIPDISTMSKGATAVVDDRFGGYEALGLAEWLATQGLAVTLTTPGRRVAANALLDLVVQPALERLQTLEVDVQTKVDSPPLADLTLTVDKHPHDPLSADLTAANLTVHVIGDAHTPGTVLTAIADAHRIDFSD
ncbi:MAG: NAD(P)-binding protein [Acidimicrobiia bacterium]|nr:NAD(P)-binding protein [Acidimicrobiia bacterium]MYG71764.1 NAD(P)-binding protein [Acidimicrobiia bacterium]MYH95631.1 NAD(P)-binding protein [Acidimicrobiia bacterium]MYL08198.1 NAD(P)-binding protein [Acidimicrobiia bacterium]